MVRNQNGRPVDIRYKGIFSSVLYKAMAELGIENFTFEVLKDGLDNNLLNDIEKQYITELNCRYPLGYNMTSGGGSKYEHLPQSIESMKTTKRERINTTRHEFIHDMPAYFTYETTLNAILLQKHPLCKFKGFYANTYGSIESAKQAAVEFLQILEKEQKVHVKERKITNSPAKGVYEIPEGSGKFYVHKQCKKITYRKAFTTETPEKNKNAAIAYAANPT